MVVYICNNRHKYIQPLLSLHLITTFVSSLSNIILQHWLVIYIVIYSFSLIAVALTLMLRIIKVKPAVEDSRLADKNSTVDRVRGKFISNTNTYTHLTLI